ncbi:hypothetical protein [Planococcus sp. CAU13]|nr:hypothetical protein [Planococcus sp. CAU13]
MDKTKPVVTNLIIVVAAVASIFFIKSEVKSFKETKPLIFSNRLDVNR